MKETKFMKQTILNLTLALAAAALCVACQSSGRDSESGPGHTTAYYIKVESSVPGVTIETNRVVAGKTPLTLRVFGDVTGNFHNFGSPEFVVSALPSNTNEFAQAKVFKTGRNSLPGDRIPGFIFFNMTDRTGGLSIDSFPTR